MRRSCYALAQGRPHGPFPVVHVPGACGPSWHGSGGHRAHPSPGTAVRSLREDGVRVPRPASSPAGRGRISSRCVHASPRFRAGAGPRGGCPAAPARPPKPYATMIAACTGTFGIRRGRRTGGHSACYEVVASRGDRSLVFPERRTEESRRGRVLRAACCRNGKFICDLLLPRLS